MMHQDFYVYMYMDSDNIPFYIGKGRHQRYRYAQHLKTFRDRMSFVGRKILRLGTNNIKTHFLHTNLTEDMAFYWERYWIKYIGRRNQSLGSLCNVTDGGEGVSGWKASEDQINKMRVFQRSRPPVSAEGRLKMSIAKIGKPLSILHRERLSIARRGKSRGPCSEETKQKISVAQKNRLSKLSIRSDNAI